MAGVALVVLTNHRVRGVEIDQHTSTLTAEEGPVLVGGDLRVNGKGVFRVLLA